MAYCKACQDLMIVRRITLNREVCNGRSAGGGSTTCTLISRSYIYVCALRQEIVGHQRDLVVVLIADDLPCGSPDTLPHKVVIPDTEQEARGISVIQAKFDIVESRSLPKQCASEIRIL